MTTIGGRGRTALAAVALSGTMLVAGCGSAGTSATQTPSGPAPASSIVITIKNFSFNPSSTSLKAGGTITWKNADMSTHTATDSSAGGFNSGDITPGSSYKTTISKPGKYSYMCEIHQYMTATITVS